MKRKIRPIKIAIIAFSTLLIALVGAFYVYTLDYYKSDSTALDVISNSKNIEIIDNVYVFRAESENDMNIGLIFYPGGKVEATAYAPFLKALSDEGINCVLVEMPFNLAVFNINAANNVINKFPEIKKWYLAGHSLGGAMASSYVEKNSNKLAGLILIGAYPNLTM